MNDSAHQGVPSRLDPKLLADLPQEQFFTSTVTSLHDLVDFFLGDARASVSLVAPSELHQRGAGSIAIARARVAHFHRLLVLRAAELLPEAIRAINESHLISFALATRGVLETAAVGGYHAELLALEEGSNTLPEDYDTRLRAAVLSGKFDWRRFLVDSEERAKLLEAYDKAPDKQQPLDAAKSIATMVDKLAKRVGKTLPQGRGWIQFYYALLSDICHPSAGSNLVYVAEVEPRLRAELMPPRVTLLGLATYLLPCLAYSAQTLVDILGELEELDERLAKQGPPPALGKESAP